MPSFRRSSPPVLACLSVLALAACGQSRPNRTDTDSRAGAGAVAISGQTPSGDRVFANPRYSLALPSGVFHFTNTGSTGREIHTYGRDHDFAVTAIYDPHPVSLADAVAATRAGGAIGLTHAASSVEPARLAGARSADLVTVHGTSARTAKPTSALALIALTRGGAMVSVEVVSVGSAAPAPGPIIQSVHLSGS